MVLSGLLRTIASSNRRTNLGPLLRLCLFFRTSLGRRVGTLNGRFLLLDGFGVLEGGQDRPLATDLGGTAAGQRAPGSDPPGGSICKVEF